MRQAIVDTDILSEFLRGTPSVVAKAERYLSEHAVISMSVITYYEILNGLLYKDTRRFLKRFEDFVAVNRVLPLTAEMAQEAAVIRADLRAKGLEIGHTDTLIAGTALSTGLQLVTNNTAHFKRVKGLGIDNWMA